MKNKATVLASLLIGSDLLTVGLWLEYFKMNTAVIMMAIGSTILANIIVYGLFRFLVWSIED